MKKTEFTNNFSQDYIHKDSYRFLGPNCNTYVQRVLNQFPEAQLKLPLRAVGKKYIKSK